MLRSLGIPLAYEDCPKGFVAEANLKKVIIYYLLNVYSHPPHT